jgi:hypothetical protein
MPGAMTPAERSLRASIAAHTRWAKASTVERQRTADNGQAGLLRRFAAEIEAEHGLLPVDELERRARSMMNAHMKRLALRSSQVRRGQVG